MFYSLFFLYFYYVQNRTCLCSLFTNVGRYPKNLLKFINKVLVLCCFSRSQAVETVLFKWWCHNSCLISFLTLAARCLCTRCRLVLALLPRILPRIIVQNMGQRPGVLQTEVHRPGHRPGRPRRGSADQTDQSRGASWLDRTAEDQCGVLGVVSGRRLVQLRPLHQLGHSTVLCPQLRSHEGWREMAELRLRGDTALRLPVRCTRCLPFRHSWHYSVQGSQPDVKNSI